MLGLQKEIKLPRRNERLLWMHGKNLDPVEAKAIDEANVGFVKSWEESLLNVISCVESDERSDRLWLFRLNINDSMSPTSFNKSLQSYIKSLPDVLSMPSIKVKRQTTLPTPLVRDRFKGWPITDIGLHVVNDEYNGMMVSFSYHEGRYYHVPHLQFKKLDELRDRVLLAWEEASCHCHKTIKGCCDHGCYKCFQLECEECEGTGWRNYMKWAQQGYRIDYTKKVPIAVV